MKTPSSTAVAPFPWEALAQRRIFWLGVGGVILVAGASCDRPTFDDLLGFTFIAITALLPAFLWCCRAAHGIPIYPVFAIGTLWTFALPLISHHPLVIQYAPTERLNAAIVVALTNFIGTGFWYLLTRRVAPQPMVYRGFRPGSGSSLFFAMMLAVIVFNVISVSFPFEIDPSIFSLIRAVILALANLGIFVLGYQAGQRRLRPAQIHLYAFLTICVMVSTLPSLLMVNALSDGLLAVIGFALGRGRLPWLVVGLFFGFALFLQAGKAEMREKYWSPAGVMAISLPQYPAFVSDWIGFSSRQLLSGYAAPISRINTAEDLEPQSFVERASLMHLFLQIQRMTPAHVPYLRGETYTIIPRLLIPRVFDAEKARSHLGTYILAIRYDLQRSEDTFSTTIGFGLLNEALANFGYPGCFTLGAFLGIFYGWAGRWSSSYPLLSLRAFFSILVLTVAFENEFTAGVFVTVLFQGSCALLMLSVLTMRRVTAFTPQSAESRWESPSHLIPGATCG